MTRKAYFRRIQVGSTVFAGHIIGRVVVKNKSTITVEWDNEGWVYRTQFVAAQWEKFAGTKAFFIKLNGIQRAVKRL